MATNEKNMQTTTYQPPNLRQLHQLRFITDYHAKKINEILLNEIELPVIQFMNKGEKITVSQLDLPFNLKKELEMLFTEALMYYLNELYCIDLQIKTMQHA
jgi:hypothetical protein